MGKTITGAFAIFALAGSVVIAEPTAAQSYPTKSIRMVAPLAPGGPTDFVARMLGQKVGDALGQQIVIDNRSGGGGILALELIARSPADGYNLLFGTAGNMCVAPVTNSKLPYNVFSDFAPIALVIISPQLLIAHPSLPVAGVKGLIALAKSRPGQINYASVGPGTASHLGMEMLKGMAGIDMLHVPYKGTAPALIDLYAGQVSLIFTSIPSMLPAVRSKKLNALAVSGAKRSAVAPEIPTVAESGVPEFNYVGWYGVYGPAATPKDIVAKLNAEIVRALGDKDIAQRLLREGSEIQLGTPDQFAAFMRADCDRWRKTLTAAKIKFD